MKRIYPVSITLAALFLLSGCGSSASPMPPSSSAPATAESHDAGPMKRNGTNKSLVVYFSYPENTETEQLTDAATSASIQKQDGKVVGNTTIIAEAIAQNTGSDIFSIHTEKKYPPSYDETVAIGKEEEQNHARPALSSHISNLDEYDTIFLGYPNWWGTMPMAMYTFLDTYDLSGKTVIPFATSGGSGLFDTERTIREAEPQANVLQGLAISYSQFSNPDAAIEPWLKHLGYGR